MSELFQTATANGSILFVDDDQAILSSLKRLMRKLPLQCWYASSGAEGLQILSQISVDLVVSDMRMPEMAGDIFLAQVRSLYPQTVRYLLSGQSDMQSTIAALNNGGISRFIHKPWADEELLIALQDCVRLARLKSENTLLMAQTQVQAEQVQFMNQLLEERVNKRTHMLRKAMRQLETSYGDFVRGLSYFVSLRSGLIKGQSQQVSELCGWLCDALNIQGGDKKHIVSAALLHELGKLAMPEALLSRSEVHLNSCDQEKYRHYPVIGEMALGGIKTLEASSLMIRHQNEHFDGSGYPEGLSGENIPLGARILLLCKHYVGLQTGMMRQAPLTAEDALKVLHQQAGKLYDPKLVTAFFLLMISMEHETVKPQESIVSIRDLEPGMVLCQDLITVRGVLLIAKNQEITLMNIQRLRHIREFYGFNLPVYVVNPASPKLYPTAPPPAPSLPLAYGAHPHP
ncbi:HD domain-containing phosphohydrolase [Marinobacter psychrophilus]|uniref:HD domain-containing phosphohydrolase n=1 Tax=Marinobacter psychrophilus TaxID=330734 RepID=UPI001B596E2B|nr:HD domain-containing phosphohydrolase [Marinobacter psychrophilus]MBQ0764195.1 response regulator [Marinobacter psychrophilus]MBQ0844975.1 response regulator [Marinobacter psychrophilus]